MTDKLNKINPSVDYNKFLKRLNTQFNEPTKQNSRIAPKFYKPTNKKTVL